MLHLQKKSIPSRHEKNNKEKKKGDLDSGERSRSFDKPQRPLYIIPSELEVKKIRTQSIPQKVTAWLIDQVDMSTGIPDKISIMSRYGFVDDESQSAH